MISGEENAKMEQQNTDRNEDPGRKASLSLRKIVILITLSGTYLLTEMIYGWSAVLPKLEEDTSKFVVTKDDVSWLASLTFMLVTILSPAAGILAERFGPRRVLVIAMFPVSGFWLLQAFSPYLWVLYLGRALIAASVTVVLAVVNPLIAELYPARIRGLASVSPEILGCIGMLSSYLLAYFLSWDAATAVSAAPFVPLSFMLLLVPESPYWLVRKKKIDAAERSLRLFLGRDGNVAEELQAIRNTTTDQQCEVKNQVQELRKKHNIIPVALMAILFMLRELGGRGPVFSYTVYMFRKAGVQLDAFYCTVFVGVARLASTCVSACTLDLVGRKPLLVATVVICAVSEGVAGAFLFLEVEGAAWVPLAAVIVFVIGYGIGPGPILCVYLGELLPTPVRAVGAAISTFGCFFACFVVNFVLLKMLSSLGLGPTLLVFAGANLAIAPIVIFFIPETIGRTLQDMEKAFILKGERQGRDNPTFEMDTISSTKDRVRDL